MKQNQVWVGHILALGTVAVWGTTFIATKILLTHFTAVEILLIRFVLGLVALTVAFPKRLRVAQWRQEWYFAGAGLSGVLLYYLLENIALGYSTASNIGVIVACAPMFTAIFWAIYAHERLKGTFFLGFLTSIIGIILISFQGGTQVHLNPIGDILALCAAITWGIYSVLCRKIAEFGYPTIATTRRTFFYAILFMIPVAWKMGFSPDFSALGQPDILATLIFLGVLASAACFVTWNLAVKQLGAIKASIYLYLTPVVTILCAAIVLDEAVTVQSLVGTALVIVGLLISAGRLRRGGTK